MEKVGSVIANEKLQEREVSQLAMYNGGPYNLPNYQNHHIKPTFSEYTACNGSLSDMLLPSKYNKLVDDHFLLLLGQPLVHHLSPNAQFNQNQYCTMDSHIVNPHSNNSHIVNPHSNKNFLIDDNIIIPEQQLTAPIKVNDALDFVLPPLPPLALPQSVHTRRPPLRKGTPFYRDNHIHTERKRRQDMTFLFEKLRSVLPNMQHEDTMKVDRCTIVGQVIEYVQELDKKVQALGKVKDELVMMKAKGEADDVHVVEIIKSSRHVQHVNPAPPPVVVSVRLCGPMDIFITLNCPKLRGLWPHLLSLLQDTLHLHVHNVALSCTPLFCIHSIYAKVMGSKNEEVCCDKLQKILSNFVAAYNTMF